MRSPFPVRPLRSTLGLPLSLLVVASVVVACGSSGAAAPAGYGGGAAGPAASAAPAARDLGQPGASDGSGTDSRSGGQGGSGNGPLALVDSAKIVRTGSLQLTVGDVARALTSGRTAVLGFGGYIGASQEERQDDRVVATVTYRIPVERWEDALTSLRGLGEVMAEKTDAVEVTGQLVDLAARIRNLRASETALVGYATNAPKVSDLLEIEARLTDTRGEIERLTAQQTQLQDQVALSTLTVTYATEPIAVAETAARWDPASEVDRASAQLIAVGQAIVSVGIVLAIVWLPILVVLSVLVVVGVVVARRLGWRRPRQMPPFAPPPAPTES